MEVVSLTRVWVVVDHTVPTPLQRSTESRTDILISVFLAHQDFIFCYKHQQEFYYVIFFTRIHLMICLLAMVNLTAVTTLTSCLCRC